MPEASEFIDGVQKRAWEWNMTVVCFICITEFHSWNLFDTKGTRGKHKLYFSLLTGKEFYNLEH